MGLTLVFWTAAIKGFPLNPSMGGFSKGPATKPFLTQVANTSVMNSPFSMAEGAFFSIKPGNERVRGAGFLASKKATAFEAVLFWGKVQSAQHLSMYFFKLSTSIVFFKFEGW